MRGWSLQKEKWERIENPSTFLFLASTLHTLAIGYITSLPVVKHYCYEGGHLSRGDLPVLLSMSTCSIRSCPRSAFAMIFCSSSDAVIRAEKNIGNTRNQFMNKKQYFLGKTTLVNIHIHCQSVHTLLTKLLLNLNRIHHEKNGM